MKALQYASLLILLLPMRGMATETDSTAKAYYFKAKERLENMLSGKEKPSYEEAIYQIENAWYEGGVNHMSFRRTLDFHTDNIRNLMIAFRDNTKANPKSDLLETAEIKKQKYQKTLANYAIYRYMTQASIGFNRKHILYHKPYTYATKDPFGTTDWKTTQVIHLVNEQSGNCFAMASLFKIFSERFHSEANLCTAPEHIYIRHADEKGTLYNVELSSRSFPGTGTLETLTYTPDEATKNNVALRELDTKQSVALCLVYLAKGYEYKFHVQEDDFMLACAETALHYDDHNLNAMLLKAEIFETRLVKKNKNLDQLRQGKEFQDYEQWVTHIFQLGYREMPFEMKNLLIKGWTKDTLIKLATTDHTPSRMKSTKLKDTRYAGLSWGLFDEEIRTKPIERYGNTAFDTKKKKIVGFLQSDILYNQYNFDPVVFAWNVDPLAHKFPWQSPYAAMDNNPIVKNDPTGSSGEVAIDKQAHTITVSSSIIMYGGKASTELAVSTARDIQNNWNKAAGVVKVDGVEYNVQFKIVGSYRSDLTMPEVVGNSDIKNNYIRVEDNNSIGVSYMHTNGNDGFFKLSNIEADGSTTEAHEYGHGLGLWPGTEDGHPEQHDIRGQGRPGIMYARGTIVDCEYQYDPNAAAGAAGGTIDPSTRQTNQCDIDMLGLDKLNYGSDGKANLGTTTNTYMYESD